MIKVSVDCPICGDTMDLEVKIIEDSDGDASIPNGVRHFYALDDYKLPTDAHQECIKQLKGEDDISSQTSWPWQSELDKLLDKATDLAIPIFQEGQYSD